MTLSSSSSVIEVSSSLLLASSSSSPNQGVVNDLLDPSARLCALMDAAIVLVPPNANVSLLLFLDMLDVCSDGRRRGGGGGRLLPSWHSIETDICLSPVEVDFAALLEPL